MTRTYPWKFTIEKPQITARDFQQLYNLSYVVAHHKRVEPAQVAMVTDDIYKLPLPFDGYRSAQRSAKTSVGFAYPGLGLIWLDTRSSRTSADVHTTAVHELAHLFAHSDCHGPAWRKFYAQTLSCWLHHSGIEDEEIYRQIRSIVRKYRKYRASTPQGGLNHYSAYHNKVDDETAKIMRSARPLWTKTAHLW